MNTGLRKLMRNTHWVFSLVLIAGFIIATTSCTSMLLASGEAPERSRNLPETSIHAQFGSPKKRGLMTPAIRELLENNTWKYKGALADVKTYEIIDIKGPFRASTMDELEACLKSAYTLGIAEIFMLPPAIVDKIKNHSEIRTFAFLYNNAGEATTIVEITDSIFDQICSMDEDNRPSIQHGEPSQ